MDEPHAHGTLPPDDSDDETNPDFWDAAGAQFRELIDKRAWPGGAPWTRPVPPGEPDCWRIHAFAMDQLGEFLTAFLPHGKLYDAGTRYAAQHPHGLGLVWVDLLSGRWATPGTGQHGGDLVGLFAHLHRLPLHRAARKLARWANVEGTRDAR